ncbi:MAG: hypothetical protein JXQ67_04125 [Campylobacterales bacterium]|nr:hypothetical protein [Campylobacterales bacterium]
MKRTLQKAVLATVLASAPAMAAGYTNTTESLFAVEGGMTHLTADVNQNGYSVQQESMGHFGLKLGAQGENYRVFVSGRYFLADKGNTIATGGVEAQYKFNFSEPVDFFIGANAGVAAMKIGASDDGLLPSVSTQAPYFGGDAGFNFHASELVDIELGAKYMHITETITQGTTVYDFNNMISGYASIIIKWQMQ